MLLINIIYLLSKYNNEIAESKLLKIFLMLSSCKCYCWKCLANSLLNFKNIYAIKVLVYK